MPDRPGFKFWLWYWLDISTSPRLQIPTSSVSVRTEVTGNKYLVWCYTLDSNFCSNSIVAKKYTLYHLIPSFVSFVQVYWHFFFKSSKLSVLTNVTHALEKDVYSEFWGVLLFGCSINVISVGFSVIQVFYILTIIFKFAYKSYNFWERYIEIFCIIMDFSNSSHSSASICIMYFGIVLLGTYTLRIVISFW